MLPRSPGSPRDPACGCTCDAEIVDQLHVAERTAPVREEQPVKTSRPARRVAARACRPARASRPMQAADAVSFPWQPYLRYGPHSAPAGMECPALCRRVVNSAPREPAAVGLREIPRSSKARPACSRDRGAERAPGLAARRQARARASTSKAHATAGVSKWRAMDARGSFGGNIFDAERSGTISNRAELAAIRGR